MVMSPRQASDFFTVIVGRKGLNKLVSVDKVNHLMHSFFGQQRVTLSHTRPAFLFGGPLSPPH